MKVIVKDINTGIEVLKDLDSLIANSLIREGLAKYPEQEIKVKILKKNKNEKNI